MTASGRQASKPQSPSPGPGGCSLVGAPDPPSVPRGRRAMSPQTAGPRPQHPDPGPGSAPGRVPGLGGVRREEPRARDSESISTSLTSQCPVSRKLSQGPRWTPPEPVQRVVDPPPTTTHPQAFTAGTDRSAAWRGARARPPAPHTAGGFLDLWRTGPGSPAQQTPGSMPSPRDPAPGFRPATRTPTPSPWGAGTKQPFLPDPGTLLAPQQLSLLS